MRRYLACLIISVGSLVALLPTGIGSSDGGPPDPPEWPNKYYWSPGPSFTGDLVVELTADWGEDNACVVYHGAAGSSNGTGLHRFRMSDRGGWSASSGGSLLTAVAQAHVGALDTRELTDSSGGGWGSRSRNWGEGFSGSEILTFAAFGTAQQTFSGEHLAPFELELSCRDPFAVTSLAGSKQAIGFTESSMEGTGASVNTLVGPEAAVNLEDGHAARFHTETVRLAVRGFQLGGAAAGTVDLTHPEGHDQYLVHSLSPNVDHLGPGGDHDLRVTRLGAADADIFIGILAGLDTVDHLDEILRDG